MQSDDENFPLSEISSWDWKSLKKSQQYVGTVVMIICLSGGILVGYSLGVISGVLISIEKIYDLNLISLGYVVATISVGNIIGSCFTLQFVEKFGYIKIRYLQNSFLTIGAFLISTAFDVEMIYIGRFLIGLGLPFSSHLNQTYLQSISPTKFRNQIISFYHISISFGIFLSSLFCFLFQGYRTGWRFLFAFQVLLGGVHATLSIYLPESPQWLANHHQEHKSREILSQIYDTQFEIDEAICFFSQNHLIENSSNLQQLKPKELLYEYRYGVLCLTVLLLIQHFTGSYLLRNYSTYLFLEIGFTSFDSFLFTLIISICQMITILWFIYQVDLLPLTSIAFPPSSTLPPPPPPPPSSPIREIVLVGNIFFSVDFSSFLVVIFFSSSSPYFSLPLLPLPHLPSPLLLLLITIIIIIPPHSSPSFSSSHSFSSPLAHHFVLIFFFQLFKSNSFLLHFTIPHFFFSSISFL
jgi:hypothetical protein